MYIGLKLGVSLICYVRVTRTVHCVILCVRIFRREFVDKFDGLLVSFALSDSFNLNPAC